MTKKIFLTTILLFAFFVGNVKAQEVELPDPGMLPTSPVYFLKSWSEGIRTFFTFGQLRKAERFFELSEIRLAEIEAVVEKADEDTLEKFLAKYEKQLGLALEKAEQAKEKGLDVEELLEKIAQATMKHQEVLTLVYDRAPEQAKEAIRMAKQQSLQGGERALENISEQNREKVMNTIRERWGGNLGFTERFEQREGRATDEDEIRMIEEQVREIEKKMQGMNKDENPEIIAQEIQQVRERIENTSDNAQMDGRLERVRERLNQIE